MIAAAQSFQGLGRDEPECHRLVDTASGGWIGMRGKNNDALCEKSGTRIVSDPSRHLNGSTVGSEGTLAASETYLVHPNQLRRFEPGQAVYVQGLRAVWGQVAPIDLDDLPALEHPDWTRIPTPGPRVSTEELRAARPESKPAGPAPRQRPTHSGSSTAGPGAAAKRVRLPEPAKPPTPPPPAAIDGGELREPPPDEPPPDTHNNEDRKDESR